MSYEAWGDDDDGLDGYREQLRREGWLDGDEASELRKALVRLYMAVKPSAIRDEAKLTEALAIARTFLGATVVLHDAEQTP